MDQKLRRELIGRNLGIKPINHGLVYTFQVAIPEGRQQTLSMERRQALGSSLLTQGSNLVSIVIRRTEAYDDEDIEYELVHGADWLQVAQELDIEKVWAWVFDLTDEQAIATAEEMKQLSGIGENRGKPEVTSESPATDIADLIEHKLQLSATSTRAAMTHTLQDIKNELDEKLKLLNYRIEALGKAQDSGALETVLEKLENMERKIGAGRKPSLERIDDPINLAAASQQDIGTALEQVSVSRPQIQAAIRAVDKWRAVEEGLTWSNLKRSATASKSSADKVSGFGNATYDALWSVAYLPNDLQDSGGNSGDAKPGYE